MLMLVEMRLVSFVLCHLRTVRAPVVRLVPPWTGRRVDSVRLRRSVTIHTTLCRTGRRWNGRGITDKEGVAEQAAIVSTTERRFTKGRKKCRRGKKGGPRNK